MFNLSIKEFIDFRLSPIVAVDFSSVSIKVLWLNQSNSHWEVQRFGQVYLPEGVCEGMTIKNVAVFSQMLRSLFVSLDLNTNKAMIALPDSVVISKTIQVNEGLTEEEIEQLIILEFDNYIPYPLGEVDFDFEIIGPSSKKKNLCDILLVATRKDNLQSILEAFILAHLEVVVVDVMSYTFERALPLLVTPEEEEMELIKRGLILIFDLGATHTRLYAFSEGELVFTREEDFGGQQLLETVAAHNTELNQEDQVNWLHGKIPKELSAALLVDLNTTLITQLNRSLEFFLSVSHFDDINRIYLSGGLAHLSGLVELTEQKMNIPAYLANPFTKISFASGVNQTALLESSAAWVSICGLAVREKRKTL